MHDEGMTELTFGVGRLHTRLQWNLYNGHSEQATHVHLSNEDTV